MRKLCLFAALILLVASNALAVEKTIFKCDFTSSLKGTQTCHAFGKICPEKNTNGECHDFLKIACEGIEIYKGALKVKEQEEWLKLAGVPNVDEPYPPYILARAPEELPDTVSAWLYLKESSLRGFCLFVEKPEVE